MAAALWSKQKKRDERSDERDRMIEGSMSHAVQNSPETALEQNKLCKYPPAVLTKIDAVGQALSRQLVT